MVINSLWNWGVIAANCRALASSALKNGSIKENAEPGTIVQLDHPIKVTDPDEEDNTRLQLLGKGSSLFKLDPETREISLRAIGNSTKNIMG